MTKAMTGRIWCVVAVVSVLACAGGCVRRTLRITTEPTNALVFLNDQEVGRSELTTDFLWYGDYDVVIRKEGYETLTTHWDVKPPWYQRMPIDFVAEVLWPAWIHDVHTEHFILQAAEPANPQELIERALSTRAEALNPAIAD